MSGHRRRHILGGSRCAETIVHDGPLTKSEQIARIIAARITRRDIDRRLPPMHQIAAEFGVSRGTVSRALAVLRERGLVVTSPGRGTFAVRPRRPASRPPIRDLGI